MKIDKIYDDFDEAFLWAQDCGNKYAEVDLDELNAILLYLEDHWDGEWEYDTQNL